jgi:uncharacterized protein YeaO (DUF488 family)
MKREVNATVRIKRAYEPPEAGDGHRVLVERLWPRGLRKDALRLDAWLKPVAPSDALRRWFGHDPARWPEFVRRYRAELRRQPAATPLADLVRRSATETVTLIYAARDQEHNSAVVLRDAIEALRAVRLRRPRRARSGS